MTDRNVRTIARPTPQPGAGILRPFPSAEISHLDPFVFLDTGAPQLLGDGSIVVPPHSHRGVQPVGLMFRARVEHRDSLGNQATVHSGGMQWLVAGSGALHEEILKGDESGIFHMAQLWVNVPAEQKMDPPAHHAVDAARVPVLSHIGVGTTIRLFAGALDDARGPAPLGTPVLIAHVVIAPAGSVSIPVPNGWNTGFSVVDGTVELAGHGRLDLGATPVFEDDGDTVTISSVHGGEVLFMSGRPIDEPIAMGGGFVMNSQEEIRQAFADEAAGRMGRLEATA